MSDVSSRTWSLFEAAVEAGFLTTEDLLHDLTLDRSVLTSPNGRIPWDDWTRMCERLVRKVPLERIATLALDTDIMGPLRSLSRLIASPRDLYVYGIRFVGPVIYRPVDFVLTELDGGLRLEARIKQGFAGCRAWIDMTRTAARVLPRVIGLPDVVVTLEQMDDRSFLMEMRLPPSMTLASRFVRAWRSFRGGPGLFDEIGYYGAEAEAAQADLRTAEEGMRSAFDALDAYAAIHDAGAVLYANEPMRGLLGDADLVSIVSEPHRGRLREYIASGETARELFSLPGDGRAEIVQSVPFRFGGRAARLLLAHDVTERTLLEERVAVADRMASLGTLAAGAAHEINNPLTFVQLNIEHALAELQEGEVDPSALTAVLQEARDGVQRIGGIVSDLQQYSKARGPSIAPVHVLTAVRRAHALAEPKLGLHIEVTTDVPEPLHAATNGDHLVQVLVNLIVNGVQAILGAAEAGSVRVRASAEADRVVIEVTDSGPGIDEEVLPRIFDPFFTTKEDGTGLGLALSQQMIHDSGGTLVARNTGSGSCFVITLPAAAPAPPTPGTPTPDSLPRTRRILVVDDELLVGRAISRMLREHDVRHLLSADEALSALTEFDPDVILCDVNMPGMRGDELLRTLRAGGYSRPFAFITGGTLDPVARETAEQHGAQILQKPFGKRELQDLLAAMEPGGA